jgi:hypothetical protein
MIGVYFTYEANVKHAQLYFASEYHVLNSQGHIYNEKSRKFEAAFRVCGLRLPTRNARQTSWRTVAKNVMVKHFEEGYPSLKAGRTRYTTKEHVIIYATPFAIDSVKQTKAGFVLKQNSTVKPLPTGLVKTILATTEQSRVFFYWATTPHEREVAITKLFDAWPDHAVASITGDGAYWFFKKQGEWNTQPIGQRITRIINCVKRDNAMIVIGKQEKSPFTPNPRMVGYRLDLDAFTVTQIDLPKEIEALLQ